MAMNKMKILHDIKNLVREYDNKTYYFKAGTILDLWDNDKQIPSVIYYLKVKKDVLYICVSDVWLDHSVEKLSDFDIEEVYAIYQLIKNNK